MHGDQINITLGTAGHIDHGKTALVKCLTGCDTDYLKEEKERGMSIELGFAPCVVSGMQVGIVDVPGHEHFIKTMVAGAASMDGVLFVVAADDGVMPQTREHLDILTLLGLKHGIVIITKCDKVSDAELEKARHEIMQFVCGTFLQNAPAACVSNITGAGYDTLIDELKNLVSGISPKNTDGPFRMPVEKVFSVKGYGTVITGIPVSGSARLGTEVCIEPGNLSGRIKTIQVYSRASDTVRAGQCAALNIPQLESGKIKRGQVLASCRYFTPSSWYTVELKLLPHENLVIKNGQKVKFHTGASMTGASIYLLESQMLVGSDSCLAQLKLDEPVVAGPGDRFIIRQLSPANTIGGGTVLESAQRRIKSRPETLQNLKLLAMHISSPLYRCEHQVKTAGPNGIFIEEMATLAKVELSIARACAEELIAAGRVMLFGSSYLHLETIDIERENVIKTLSEFHNANPESPGMTLEEMGKASGLGKAILDHIVTILKNDGIISTQSSRVHLKEHKPRIADRKQALLSEIEAHFETNCFNPPSLSEICSRCRLAQSDAKSAIKLLKDYGKVVEIERDMLFHFSAIEKARNLLIEHIKANGGLESVKFKYLLDTSRKFAIPLLDYFDRIGLTRRQGYTRLLK